MKKIEEELIDLYRKMLQAGLCNENSYATCSIRLTDDEKVAVLGRKNCNMETVLFVDMEGNVVQGDKSLYDAHYDAHLAIYKKYPDINIITEPENKWFDIWTISGGDIPPVSIKLATRFLGEIPCSSPIRDAEVTDAFFYNMGEKVIRTLNNKYPLNTKSAYIVAYGFFVFGTDGNTIFDDMCLLNEMLEKIWQYRIVSNEQYRYLNYSLAEKIYNHSKK